MNLVYSTHTYVFSIYGAQLLSEKIATLGPAEV
jgi:hypothetical protein